MNPRIKEIHDYLVSARVHLRDAYEAVPAEFRDIRPEPDRWSVAEVIEHLSIVETRIARLFAKKLAAGRTAGVGAETATTTVLWTLDVMRVLDRRERIEAPEPIRPAQVLSSRDAWAALEQAHITLCDTIVSSDGVALGEISHPHPVMGVLNFYQWGVFAAAHEMRHALQIREVGEALAARAASA